jgi:hypothetical protein
MASIALAVQPATQDASDRKEEKLVHSHHGLVKENCCIHGHCDCSKVSPGYAGGELLPVKVVHVRYRAGDKLGYFLGIVTLVPIFIALGSIPTIVLFWRDVPTSFFAVGLLLSEAINQVKNGIRGFNPFSNIEACMCAPSNGNDLHPLLGADGLIRMSW